MKKFSDKEYLTNQCIYYCYLFVAQVQKTTTLAHNLYITSCTCCHKRISFDLLESNSISLCKQYYSMFWFFIGLVCLWSYVVVLKLLDSTCVGHATVVAAQASLTRVSWHSVGMDPSCCTKLVGLWQYMEFAGTWCTWGMPVNNEILSWLVALKFELLIWYLF